MSRPYHQRVLQSLLLQWNGSGEVCLSGTRSSLRGLLTQRTRGRRHLGWQHVSHETHRATQFSLEDIVDTYVANATLHIELRPEESELESNSHEK